MYILWFEVVTATCRIAILTFNQRLLIWLCYVVDVIKSFKSEKTISSKKRIGKHTRLAWVITHDILVFHIEKSSLSKNKQNTSIPCVFLGEQICFFIVLLGILFCLSRAVYLRVPLVDHSNFESLGRLYRTLNNEFT